MVYKHRLFDVNEFPLFVLVSTIVNDQIDVSQALADWLQQTLS
jgi:hypothetical protein